MFSRSTAMALHKSITHNQGPAFTYEMNPLLDQFWHTPSRYKALYGGRASSKSHDAAGHAIRRARTTQLRFLCARQFQNRIDESVYTLLKGKIDAANAWREFKITNTSILHRGTGSEFIFYGIARNLNEIKSTEGVDVLWLEEAHYLTEEMWNVIEPTIRKDNSEIWLVWNPDELLDFVYQKFVVHPPEDCLSQLINWTANPFLTETMLKVILEMYRNEPELAEQIYGGMPKTGGDKSVISLKYVLAAQNAHKKIPGWDRGGARKIGYDVADDGDDQNATVETEGNIIVAAREWRGLEDELTKHAADVWTLALKTNSHVNYDTIGVGAFVGSRFEDLNRERNKSVSYSAFNAGGGVDDPDGVFMKLPHVTITNREHFSNIKAQKWMDVATRFRKTYERVERGIIHPIDELVSIDTEALGEKMTNQLSAELSTPRKDTDGMGKFKVESKKDMKDKRKIKSPNVADAAIMSLINPKKIAKSFLDY